MTTHLLLNQLPSFEAVKAQASALRSANIDEMFSTDTDRIPDFICEGAGLTLDYSKALLSREARSALVQLAEDAQWKSRVSALLNGEALNTTENRAALHTLLRASSGGDLPDLFMEVSNTRKRMKQWTDQLNQGLLKGFSGNVITDVVNIGIGGSDLGPRLVSDALTPFHGSVACHYVANVDPADLQDQLLYLDPGSTLFIICSKSFRTQETLTNALAARSWLKTAGASSTDLDKHFLAITTNLKAASDFGIPETNCLPLWDWVGGRYSVWSAVGLSCAIAIGWENFTLFLEGAQGMDRHLEEAPAEQNLPLILSLLEVWYCSFFGAQNYAVLPYSQHLERLPDFLQQLTMESNGKCVSIDGSSLPYNSGPVLWGAAGTMGQHSFHQLLHQGTHLCPTDFILPLTTHTPMAQQHRQLVANCLAQSRAMMIGRPRDTAYASLLGRGIPEDEADRLAPHLAMPGNRPNNLITMEALTPNTLGALLTLYEHRTFLSGQLWGINPFDQWGVELGKEIGEEILGHLSGETQAHTAQMDSSTSRLVDAWRKLQENH